MSFLVALAWGGPFAEAGRVVPVEPGPGSRVGARPVFRVLVEGDGPQASDLVLELSRDGWRSVETSWPWPTADVKAANASQAGDTAAVFECPLDLAEGAWSWRVRARSDEAAGTAGWPRFHVDATPPAEVEGLQVRRGPDGSVVLSWLPVLLDLEGRPEQITHYVVYRYDSRGVFRQDGRARVEATSSLVYVDRPNAEVAHPEGRSLPAAGATAGGKGWVAFPAEAEIGATSPVLYYKVVAVDAAGNELGSRGRAVGSQESRGADNSGTSRGSGARGFNPGSGPPP